MKTSPLKSSSTFNKTSCCGAFATSTSTFPSATSNSPVVAVNHDRNIMALSPIASSPKNAFKLPSGLGLAPATCRAAGDEPELTHEIPESTSFWTSSLLSPVLKLFGNNENSFNSNISSDDSTDANSETKLAEDESFESKTTDDEMDEVDDEEDNPVSYEFDPFLFMAQLPPHYMVRHNVPDARSLPMTVHSSKPTLVLDLDETLVHCSADPRGKWDVTFSVQFNGSLCQVYVRKRPHLEAFLEAVSSKFEVVLFTASQRVYAEKLLDILDPQGRYIHHRLYRESCLMVAGNLLKDLTILDRDLRRTVIVDNSPHAFGYQLDNGIPIESWYEDPHDVELLKLLPLLDQLHQANDVRPHLRQMFRMHNLVNEARARC